QAEVRTVDRAHGFEARQLEPGEQLVVEPDRAAIDHRATSGTCAAGFAVQAKWQAATWSVRPGPAVSAGSSVLQTGSCAIGQRGWKWQPLGSLIGLGGSPTTAAAA